MFFSSVAFVWLHPVCRCASASLSQIYWHCIPIKYFSYGKKSSRFSFLIQEPCQWVPLPIVFTVLYFASCYMLRSVGLNVTENSPEVFNFTQRLRFAAEDDRLWNPTTTVSLGHISHFGHSLAKQVNHFDHWWPWVNWEQLTGNGYGLTGGS